MKKLALFVLAATLVLKQDIMDFIARFVPYGDDPVVAKRPAYNYDVKTNDRFMIFGSR